MNIEIIKPESLKTGIWSGGTTTQLFIFPTDAEYQKRNFDFRLSTAKVEIEKSDFTQLPGVSRKIMILDGQIIINHENRYSKKLESFETDCFEGDWKTSSEGKCTDFNLMTTGKTTGSFSACFIEKDKVYDFESAENLKQFFIYAFSGNAEIDFDSEKINLSTGSLLRVFGFDSFVYNIKSSDGCNLVFVEIF